MWPAIWNMEIVENTLEVSVDDFLERPLFCFLGQCADAGPRLSPLWFLWEDGSVWIVAQLDGRSYPERVRQDPRSAVGIVDFDPATGRVEHVGMRGEATLEPYDEDRARRLFEKYLGPERSEWPESFVDLDVEAYRLLTFEPATVVARDQSYAVPSRGG